MFRKILVVYSEKRTEAHINALANFREIIKKNFSGEIFFVELKKVHEKNFEGVDLVITFGGDGTFIRASNFIEKQLVVGINSDSKTSEGALKSLFAENTDKIKEILEGKYKLIERQRARVILNGKKIRELVLNSVFVGASSQFHSSRYILKYRGKEEEHRSSGILISTGTGSSAWFKSAGGSLFKYDEKKLKFIVREPYFGNRIYKPTLLSGEILEKEKIEIISLRHDGGVLAVDDAVYKLKEGDKIEIELSDEPLRVIVV